jgi:hypothetical protein
MPRRNRSAAAAVPARKLGRLSKSEIERMLDAINAHHGEGGAGQPLPPAGRK